LGCGVVVKGVGQAIDGGEREGNEDRDMLLAPDCAGTLTSGGYNLIGDDTGCTGFTNGVNGDQVGVTGATVEPTLGPLQDNGGCTLTRLPQSGSPVIDAIPPARCLVTTDQRGQGRPADGGTGRAYCDVGAVEAQPGEVAPTGPPAATPELGSGELVVTGVSALGLVIITRRRRR